MPPSDHAALRAKEAGANNSEPTRRKSFWTVLQNYSKVIGPLAKSLAGQYPWRIVFISACGISAFVLQIGVFWLIFNVIGQTPAVQQLFAVLLGDDVSSSMLISVGLVTGLFLLVVSALATFAGQSLSVWTARDFSQSGLARLFRLMNRASAKLDPADFSAAARAKPVWTAPPIQDVSYMHRALDIFARVSLVSSPQALSTLVGIGVLSWLNITATLALTPLVLLQILVVYWQSRRGATSRTRLENSIGDLSADRRRFLQDLTRQTLNVNEADAAVEKLVYGRLGARISREFAFQFAVLYESNFTSKLIAVSAFAIVLVTFALQSPAPDALVSARYWTGVAFYLVVIRFVFSELENVMRAVVAINRLYAHLSNYVLTCNEQRRSMGEMSRASKVKSVPEVPAALEIGPASSAPRVDEQSKQPALAVLEKLQAGLLELRPGSAAIAMVPHSMYQLDPLKYRRHMGFSAGASISLEAQRMMKCWRRAVPESSRPLSLREAFHNGPAVTQERISRFCDAIGAKPQLREMLVREPDEPLPVDEWKILTGFHGFLLDIVEAIHSPHRLLMVELSMVNQLEKGFGINSRRQLFNLLREKIVLYMHYRPNEDALSEALGLPVLLFARDEYFGWVTSGQIDYATYALLANEKKSRKTNQKPSSESDAPTSDYEDISLF